LEKKSFFLGSPVSSALQTVLFCYNIILHDIDTPYSLITDGNSVESICLFDVICRFTNSS